MLECSVWLSCMLESTLWSDVGLSEGESVIHLYVEKAELQCATGANFASFIELDFFQHAAHTTPIVQGPRYVPCWQVPRT